MPELTDGPGFVGRVLGRRNGPAPFFFGCLVEWLAVALEFDATERPHERRHDAHHDDGHAHPEEYISDTRLADERVDEQCDDADARSPNTRLGERREPLHRISLTRSRTSREQPVEHTWAVAWIVG